MFAQYKSGLDLEMKTSIRRYFFKQQNHGRRIKKAPSRYLSFFYYVNKIKVLDLPMHVLESLATFFPSGQTHTPPSSDDRQSCSHPRVEHKEVATIQIHDA